MMTDKTVPTFNTKLEKDIGGAMNKHQYPSRGSARPNRERSFVMQQVRKLHSTTSFILTRKHGFHCRNDKLSMIYNHLNYLIANPHNYSPTLNM